MFRKIALSNLSILGTSLAGGPTKAWALAQSAGFDALKVNPIRGWDASGLLKADVPVTAFEAPWRYSFSDTLRWVLETNEWRALLMDPILFGYQAVHKVKEFAEKLDPEVIAVDCEEILGRHAQWALETDATKYGLFKVLNARRLLFDTWHMREYAPGMPTYEGFDLCQIVAIDVQTRDLLEWQAFLERQPCLLLKQLVVLRDTPETVSAALEVHPVHLKKLAQVRGEKTIETLKALQQRVRECLG
jgi:hypothetical protein